MGIGEKLNLGEKEKKLVMKLGLVVLAALFLLFFSNLSTKDTTTVTEETTAGESTNDILADLEKDLETALSDIEGAGAVTVEIKWQGITEKEYAYNLEESERESDTDTEKSSRKEMVLLDGETSPVLVNETLPPIEGVLIIAEGAYDPDIRETLLNATATFLDIGANRIQIARKG